PSPLSCVAPAIASSPSTMGRSWRRGRPSRCSPIPPSSRRTWGRVMLTLERVHCHYAKVHVLHDVSLRVERGEIVCMIGPNAAGKTTTLRVISGLKEPTSRSLRYLHET